MGFKIVSRVAITCDVCGARMDTHAQYPPGDLTRARKIVEDAGGEFDADVDGVEVVWCVDCVRVAREEDLVALANGTKAADVIRGMQQRREEGA